jgi:DNA modification methylase
VIRLLTGDCRDVLKTLPDESVHCVVTSPPYWGLRDYGTAKWEGGDPNCEHTGVARRCDAPGRNDKQSTQKGNSSDRVSLNCLHCGARRIDSQIGLEPSFHDYIETMTGVFREVRRVLRRDGTLWLNMGDSYATSVNGRSAADTKLAGNDDRTFRDKPFSTCGNGLKPKDLCGIPWRLAFALQDDGWYLRSDIIWSKPNPMPESVTDRPTKAHEYLFLMTKSERYYYDAEAIKEDVAEATANDSRVGTERIADFEKAAHNFGAGTSASRRSARNAVGSINGRNRRTVWEVATSPFPEAHFATFPPALVEPCIKAGTSERGCCAKCGAPWVREVERGESSWESRKAVGHPTSGYHAFDGPISSRNQVDNNRAGGLGWVAPKKTLGWSPSCSCSGHFEEIDGPEDWISRETGERKKLRVYVPNSNSPPPVPCICLDPFGGAGTTGLVADRLGRNAILIELNPQYAEMAERRLKDDAGLFYNAVDQYPVSRALEAILQ